MQTKDVYTYQWNLSGDNIDVFGITETGETVYVKVTGFTPYVYVELPLGIDWKTNINTFCEKFLVNIRNKPVKKSLVFKRKLYFAHKDANGNDKLFPYLMLAFSDHSHIKQLRWMKPITIPGFCERKTFRIHEQDASPILQMTCINNITPVGWVKVRGTQVTGSEKTSICDLEYVVYWKRVFPSTLTATVDPLIMCFDIECNSSNPAVMPDANNPRDKIFQISISLTGRGVNEKHLLSLGNPDEEIVGSPVTRFNTEHSLLTGFSKFIKKYRPQVVAGYNIFGFDIPYMIARAKHLMCLSTFDMQGYIIGRHAEQKNIKWSSSAYKDQHFEYLDASGVMYVDLLPIVKKDYKLDNYKLKTVSEHFLKNSTKDPLTAQDIFKCYRTFSSESLGVVGKYCVQDSVLVSSLMNVLQVWVGLSEMARTCNVPMFTLFTQGQQIKVYSQVYKYCMEANIVVEKDGYVGNDRYTGAYVVDPVPGVYDNVVPFDFASLYPTTIIAYNIDYSTMIVDESVPDSSCTVIEWEDHVGCLHDTRKVPKDKVICAHNKFRFLKKEDGLGVIPTIITNLLDARRVVRNQIRELKKNGGDKGLIDALDKRQLSYKISANSMYGALGVQRGYLPFMPAAMCTTAMGRKSIIKAANYIRDKYSGKIVYGDTDSTMIVFDEPDYAKLWSLCERVAVDVSALFPAPMELEFEEKIYKRFFILTKKRYMALECDREGVMTGKITKKGILLARRDNSKVVRDIYEATMMRVLNTSIPDIPAIVDGIDAMFQRVNDHRSYVITKSVGDVDGYKKRELPTDEKKRAKRLKDLGCTVDEYDSKCLPAHIQLCEKMRRRGVRVDVGSRMEYVITCNGDKLCDKVEDIDYFIKHSAVISIDPLYYLKLLVNPIDEILNVTSPEKDVVAKLYKTHTRKRKVCSEIFGMGLPTVISEL